jgi:large subunit ribosomal protein L22
MITASLNEYRQSPRKVRLVAGLVKGKPVAKAIDILQFTIKEAALPIQKLIKSAVASAKNGNIDADSLIVKDIQVNPGVTFKRSMPRARGSAYGINKRTSHITLTLDVKTQ